MNILVLKNKKIEEKKGDSEYKNIVKVLDEKNISHIDSDILDIDIDKLKQKDISIVVAIGGDGTIIKGAKVAFALGVPICGINAGHLGYLSGIDVDDDLDISINKILDGRYNVDDRSVLNVEVISKDGKVKYQDVAINEAESLSSDLNSVTSFKIGFESKDKVLYDFSSCGVLVSTPTGSTGFSFSAGGPIVSPKVKCFVVQAIYPHAFNQRAFVVEDDKPLFIVITDKGQSLYIDGRKIFALDENDTIKITISQQSVKFVTLTDDAFYKNLKKKIRSI